MARMDKYAKNMASHLGEPIDAACPVSGPGGTNAGIGMAVGGAVGAAIGGAGKRKDSDIALGQYGWLGVGPTHFAITNASGMGKPKGDPLAHVAYTDVSAIEVTQSKLSIRADVDLADGRHIAFETKRQGMGKASVPVFELLQERCGG